MKGWLGRTIGFEIYILKDIGFGEAQFGHMNPDGWNTVHVDLPDDSGLSCFQSYVYDLYDTNINGYPLYDYDYGGNLRAYTGGTYDELDYSYLWSHVTSFKLQESHYGNDTSVEGFYGIDNLRITGPPNPLAGRYEVYAADLDYDNDVDLADIVLFAEDWSSEAF